MLRRLIFCLALAGAAQLSAQSPAPASKVIDAAQLLKDLQVLSADDMQGRLAGAESGAKARAYVIERFKASGIQPFGASYEQPFTFTAGRGGTAAPRNGVNVLGRIAGTKSPERFIVITAHYDHVGVRNGEVFNGADDNASGTAALFALGKYFTANRPQHSLIFAALDAEESGLRGARHFVANPPVDQSALVLNVNMDMIGRDAKDLLYVAGTHQQPYLKPYIEKIAASAPVKLVMGHDDPAQKNVENWMSSSDHAAFCQAKIPCLYFGVEDFENHHRASDDYETMTHAFYVRAVETMVQAVREFDANLAAIAQAAGRGGASAGGPSAGQSGTSVEIAVPGGRVAGTLLVPPGAAGKVPVALIVAGSGPTDRDGNSAALPGRNNSLKLLADALAAANIASLRYDKRGLAQSTVEGLKEDALRFETFVQDAASWVSFLRNDPRFSTITVVGHSEGSLIGMLAARAARADGFISIAGPARRASDLIREQVRAQLASAPDLAKANEAALASLEKGELVTSLPPIPALANMYRASVQPYLISWFKYEPATELARLSIPSLIVQGTTDIQIPVADAEALGRAAQAKVEIVEGMNHVLKDVRDPAKQLASYSDPSLPIAPKLAQVTTSFINALSGPGRPQPRRPPGARLSPRTTVLQDVAGALVSVEHGQPSKRNREIWGALVPWGKWWMPGADESSTLTTNKALTFGTLTVPAGEYTLYTQPDPQQFALIISRDVNVFHTVYRPDRDLGRVVMQQGAAAPAIERLTFRVAAQPDHTGVLSLAWDDREYRAPFSVSK